MMEFVFKYRGVEHRITLPFEEATLADLASRLQELTSAHLPTQKLIGPNIKGALQLAAHPSKTLSDAGVLPGKRYTLIASSHEAVQSVQSLKELPRQRGFEEEAQREAKRRSYGTSVPTPPDVEFGFDRYEVLEGAALRPAPSGALHLLYRLASDVGIQGVMKQHRWKVGLLSEMAPEGKVGISAKCVLGYNVNKGQEISLRLRTDDRKGFRKYVSIRDTLIHELTHMVWSDHDRNFKQLNAELLRECDAFLTQAQGHYLIDGEVAETDDEATGEESSDGRRLGGAPITTDAVSAAREAAIRRQIAKPKDTL